MDRYGSPQLKAPGKGHQPTQYSGTGTNLDGTYNSFVDVNIGRAQYSSIVSVVEVLERRQ